MRAFISLNLCEEKKREVFGIQSEVKKLLDSSVINSIKWEGRDKFHQTIFFLVDVKENIIQNISNDLEKIKREINFFEIKFIATNINAFPKLRYPRVLIVELENPDGNVFVLYDKICEKLNIYGFEPDKKFHPHITLGRVKRDRKINLEFLRNKIKINLSFNLNDFYLMESKLDSKGSVYREIKRFILG
ncbi:MAG: RNA 2',3'-cyclic phosphodiesterase [Ignavibacteriae bacterium]|nr:RNA 2',3'-cyclic phosphodiesterase [Ignavibacteriota bacterium]